MTPTPEQIAEMEARGWAWHGHGFGFGAFSGRDNNGIAIVGLSVIPWGAGYWAATYGTVGNNYLPYNRHADPLAAADEAEQWIRGVLAGFRFPWLEVKS